MTDGHLFNNISLGGRGGTNPEQLKIYSGGILWKKQGGGKAVEVDKSDILGVTWMKVPRTNQLGVRIKGGLYYKFARFRDQDVARNILTSVTGSKQAFEVSLADVSQTQLQGKNDVILEFHVDDTTGANEHLRSLAFCLCGSTLYDGPCTMHGLHSLTSGILKFWRIDCIWEFEDIEEIITPNQIRFIDYEVGSFIVGI
ncbi:hypothetical protein J1N35_036692 [Gossypium stocksii]|uniref:FACT complex subunit SSRP1/POB3 N-terminal PH domain-containing protein n=1 Tax=Gossypium stocksii TaxID=47602 RepID=A0A9D3UIS8_9ROSI|nr:hypothetical protein J1N35_036692 [Gossypium stocksii]